MRSSSFDAFIKTPPAANSDSLIYWPLIRDPFSIGADLKPNSIPSGIEELFGKSFSLPVTIPGKSFWRKPRIQGG